MRSFPLAMLVAATAPAAMAQSGGTTARIPTNWLSVGGGIIAMNWVADGTTQSTWRFSNGFPIRISLERALGRTATLGAQMTYVRMPLLYVSQTTCGSCNAHATVANYGPVLRVTWGGNWQELMELFAGVMQYGSFTADDGDVALPPSHPNRDFSYSVGLGLGHALGNDFALEFMTRYLNAIHERRNIAGNFSTLSQHGLLTVALRMGF